MNLNDLPINLSPVWSCQCIVNNFWQINLEVNNCDLQPRTASFNVFKVFRIFCGEGFQNSQQSLKLWQLLSEKLRTFTSSRSLPNYNRWTLPKLALILENRANQTSTIPCSSDKTSIEQDCVLLCLPKSSKLLELAKTCSELEICD